MTKSLERAITTRIAQLDDGPRYAVYATAGLVLSACALLLPDYLIVVVFPMGLVAFGILVAAIAGAKPAEKIAFWAGLTFGLAADCILVGLIFDGIL
ncbi:hypothetical protein ACFUEJ_11130 [Gordonia sp. NPDC057258]|uniref:hypothetical protein n=1 Tax=unclassified Gordonia (in: high G+C Gram-positive bacteria) TaxID=2657482 RepID=UPI00362DA583